MFDRLRKSLFGSAIRSHGRRPAARPRVEALEVRDVPSATVDLTALGSSGVINGAIFRQADPLTSAAGLNPFVQLAGGRDADSMQQGYNTDARPLQFDESRSRQLTHSLRVQDLPLVTVNGVAYREVLLDIDQRKSQSLLSLDELRVYVGRAANLSGYRSSNDKLAGLTAVYDMDANGNHWVLLNSRLNAGRGFGDMRLLLPNRLFTGGSPYFYLYSKFGVHEGGRNDSQEWAVGPPAQTVATGSISGVRYNDLNHNGVFDPGDGTPLNPPEPGLAGWTVYLDTNNNGVLDPGEKSTTTDQNGFFQFTNLALGTYSVRTVEQANWLETGDDPFIVALSQAGQKVTNVNLGVRLHAT